jgi:hypothetical protein
LTQEEAKMVTAEVLKSTRNVDDNVKILIDGIQSEFFSHTCCPNGLCHQMTRRQEQFCNKRSVRHFSLLPHTLLDAQSWSQERKCGKTSTVGFLPWIPQQTMKLLATLTMREQPPGSFKVVFLKNGGQLLRSCGYMENVCSCHSLVLSTSQTCILVAGSGKSVLWLVTSLLVLKWLTEVTISSGIIEDIRVKALQKTGSACLAYFYCDFRDEAKQSHRNLIISILWQLAAQSDLCCDLLSRLYSEHDDGRQRPSEGTLTRCLKEMLLLPTQRPVYLVIDALDECPNNSGMPTPREKVLDLVQDLVDLHFPNVHICITSRPEIDIRTTLEPLTTLHVSLHNQSGQTKDIIDYVSSVVYLDKKMRRWRDDDKSLVITTLSERADGM